MMRLCSALVLTALAPALASCALNIEARQAPDNSGHCVRPVSSPPAADCAVAGSVKRLGSHKTFSAFSPHECAQRCFSITACKSFGFDPKPATPNGAGTCNTLNRPFASLGFTPSSNSSTKFWSRSCFTETNTNDAPLLDGQFNDASSSAPWVGYNDPKLHYAYNDGEVAELTELSFSSSMTSEVYYAAESISQTFATCIGNTYEVTYEAADQKSNDAGELEVLANNVTLFSRSTADVESPISEQHPVYFQAKSKKTVLEFLLTYGGNKPGAGDSADEYIDAVVVQAIYRGTLPGKTHVPSV